MASEQAVMQMRVVVVLMFALLAMQLRPACADSVQGDEAFSVGDYATALQEWRRSAAAGDASAMAALGTLYDTGHGVEQDFSAALGWYSRAAEAGNVRSMFNVGAMFDNGRGTPVDRSQAVRWYTKAAQRGNGRAAYALGVIYRDGDGVQRSSGNAIRYFRVAAAAGIAAARPNLVALGAGAPRLAAAAAPPPVARAPVLDANSLEIGNIQKAALARNAIEPGALKNFAAILPALMEQAAKGNGLAQYDVGYAYEHGYAVPRDPVRAYVNYLRAAAAGEANVKAAALQGASAVGQTLNDAEHAAARDMLLEGTP